MEHKRTMKKQDVMWIGLNLWFMVLVIGLIEEIIVENHTWFYLILGLTLIGCVNFDIWYHRRTSSKQR